LICGKRYKYNKYSSKKWMIHYIIIISHFFEKRLIDLKRRSAYNFLISLTGGEKWL
jgi:hypothetical protein